MTAAQLRAFLAALDLGSFTAAASYLESTQASISELVSRLERETGTRLFTRGGRRLMPTGAANELHPHAVQAVAAIDAGMASLNAVNSLEGGVCTFGVLRHAAYYDLSDLAQRFHRRYPKVRVRLVGLNSALVADSIAAGAIEAGLVVLPVPEQGLKVKPLFRDEVVYASARRSPDAGPVTWEELVSNSLVLYDAYAGWRDPTRLQLLERLQTRGLEIDPVVEVEHVETALSLVASGAADTFVSTRVAQAHSFPQNVMTTSFQEPFFDTIALAQRVSGTMSPATRAFAELAQRTLLKKVATDGR